MALVLFSRPTITMLRHASALLTSRQRTGIWLYEEESAFSTTKTILTRSSTSGREGRELTAFRAIRSGHPEYITTRHNCWGGFCRTGKRFKRAATEIYRR